jgi:23S rRNA pseudoU1915 N3-methylase RlmH
MRLEILQKKKELFSRIYDITRDTVFSGDENDAVRYADLMEKREKLFDQIKLLDDKISDAAPSKEAERIIADIKKTASDIISLDKQNAAMASRIMADVKKSLKDVHEGMNVSKGYSDHLVTSDGMYFDQKN